MCLESSTRRQMLSLATTYPYSSPFSHRYRSTTAAGPVGDQEARLGLQRLDEAVCELFSQGLAESTRAVYRSGWRQYTRFCHKFSISPLPVHEHPICQFAADLSASVGWGTIRSYLSAVRFYQISAARH